MVSLLAVLVFAFVLRSEGIYWPRLLHPDEQTIVKWVKEGEPGRVYASGFFVLFRPVQGVRDGIRHVAEHIRYHTGAADDVVPDGGSGLFMLIRWFNVWLGTLVCLMVFLFVRRVTGSWWGGTLAAGLLAGSAHAVEHSHYAETDVAMLFTLTAALWLWAEAAATNRRWWLAGAALAVGFAAGTKFILLVLAVTFLVFVAAQFRPVNGRRATRAVDFILALLLVGGGFLLANPWLMGAHDLGAQIALEKQRLALEGARNMGGLAGDVASRWLANLSWLGRFSLSMGWGWLVLCLGAIPLLFGASVRPYVWLLGGFPLLLTGVWVFAAPWVRSQEFLAYLPVMAGVAALPVIQFCRTGQRRGRRAARLLAAVALFTVTIEGTRMASVFGWTDTRVMADRWLDRHAPPGTGYMAEHYAGMNDRRARGREEVAGVRIKTPERKVEETSLDVLRRMGVDYVVRNHSYEARGMANPLTGQLFPDFMQRRMAFEQESERIMRWSVALFSSSFMRARTCSGFTVANSVDLGLYGMKVFPQTPDFDLALPRPVWLSPSGRETFMPDGRDLGSDLALRLDSGKREFAIGGAVDRISPVWLVFHTLERPVALKVSGYGRERSVRMRPYDVRVVTLRRPAWAPRFEQWERVSVQAEPEKAGIVHIPCFLRVAFSAEDVFRCLKDLGMEDRFGALWPVLEPAPLSPVAQAEWAMAAGDVPRLDRAIGPALELLAQMADAGRERRPFRIRGLSDHYYRRFARVRGFDQEFELAKGEPGSDGLPVFEKVIPLPIQFVSGQCRLLGECAIERLEFGGGAGMDMEVLTADSGERLTSYSQKPSREPVFNPIGIVFRGRLLPRVELRFRSAERLRVRIRNVMAEWDLDSVVAAEQRRLMLVQAEHLVGKGEGDAARTVLSAIGVAGVTPAEQVNVARLMFEASGNPAGIVSPARVVAARRLLALAPSHGEALKVAAASDADMERRWRVLDLSAPKVMPVYEPYLKLIGCEADGDRVRGVFEACRDAVPPLALRVEVRRGGKWKVAGGVMPLIEVGHTLSRGERVGFEVSLNSLGAQGLLPRDVSLGVESLVQWYPGLLGVSGPTGWRVTLDEVMGP